MVSWQGFEPISTGAERAASRLQPHWMARAEANYMPGCEAFA